MKAITPRDILVEMQRRNPVAVGIPGKFSAFCLWLGVKLTVGQLVTAKVCYDGVDPADLEGDERVMASRIFGENVERIPRDARRVVALVCGRRAGKSYVLEALFLVFSMYKVDLFEVAPGQVPIALVISLNDGLRQEIINYAVGAIRSHAELRTTLVLAKGGEDRMAVESFMIKRPKTGEIVGFQGGVATHGGYGGRGKSLVGVAFDEAAFFKNDSYKVNDVELFNGALPGLLPEAKAVIASTPWAQSGLLYEKYIDNWDHPRDAVCAHAPTVLLRPVMRDIVEESRRKDPEYVSREYDAMFMSFGSTQFFSSSLVDSMLSKDAQYPLRAIDGATAAASVDLGMRSDSSAFSGTIRMPFDNIIQLAKLVELRPEPGRPIKPTEAAERFADEAAALGCTYVMCDGHYRESMRENSLVLKVANAPVTVSEFFVIARQIMKDGHAVLPHPDTLHGEDRETIRRLIAQLKEVQGRPIPGGGMSIIMPRWRTGGHGDLAYTYCLSIYQMGGQAPSREAASEGSAAWERQQLELRKRKTREKSTAKWRPGAI